MPEQAVVTKHVSDFTRASEEISETFVRLFSTNKLGFNGPSAQSLAEKTIQEQAERYAHLFAQIAALGDSVGKNYGPILVSFRDLYFSIDKPMYQLIVVGSDIDSADVVGALPILDVDRVKQAVEFAGKKVKEEAVSAVEATALSWLRSCVARVDWGFLSRRASMDRFVARCLLQPLESK
jgi:hypothetical protein